MIEKDEEFGFAVAMRQKILDLCAGIENASWNRFSDKSPNWQTRRHLKPLVEEFENGLLALGAKAIFAHAPCGDPLHEEKATWKLIGAGGYWRYVLADGRSDSELLVDGQLIVDGVIMDTEPDELLQQQRVNSDPCPCNPNKRAEDHTVSRYFVWPRDPGSQIQGFVDLYFVLNSALKKSGDGCPRSAIREQLLYVIMSLDRFIVPVNADEEIKKRSLN